MKKEEINVNAARFYLSRPVLLELVRVLAFDARTINDDYYEEGEVVYEDTQPLPNNYYIKFNVTRGYEFFQSTVSLYNEKNELIEKKPFNIERNIYIFEIGNDKYFAIFDEKKMD